MCHGKQQRMAGLPYPKHLHVVAGKPIIYRTIELCRQAGFNDIYVVAPNNDHWLAAQRDMGFQLVSLEDPGHCVLTGIQLVKDYWKDGGVILLGDVIYSIPCLVSLLRSNRVLFVGTEDLSSSTGELFGMHISPEGAEEIIWALEGAGIHCMRNPPVEPQGGHLRGLLWQLAGDSSRNPNARNTPLFLSVKNFGHPDYTIDLDSPDSLLRIAEIENQIDKTAFDLTFSVEPIWGETLTCFYCTKIGCDYKFSGRSGQNVITYGICQKCFTNSQDRKWKSYHLPRELH